MIIPGHGKNEEGLDLLHTEGGNVKWYSHFGKWLAVTYKVKCILTLQPSNPTPGEMKTYGHTKYVSECL